MLKLLGRLKRDYIACRRLLERIQGRLKRDYTAYRQRLQDEAKRERNAYQQRIQDLELEMRKKIDAQLAEERRRLEEQSQSEDGATVC